MAIDPVQAATIESTSPVARLSWDENLVVTDLPLWPERGTRIYVLLEGVEDCQALGIDVRWSPNDIFGPCYWLRPDSGQAVACGYTSASPPASPFPDDSTYQWTIGFASGASKRCVPFQVLGENCTDRPASFCLASVRVMDASGVIHEAQVLNSATIMGGAEEACPFVAEGVWPDSIESGRDVRLRVTGTGLASTTGAGLALADTLLVSDVLETESANALEVGFTVPAGLSGAASLLLFRGSGLTDTLASAVMVTPPSPTGYVSDHVVVWYAPGVVDMPPGVIESSPLEAAAVFSPGEVASSLEVLGVQSIRYLTPAAAAASPTSPPLFDASQLDIFVLDLADTNVASVCAALRADTVHVRDATPDWLCRFAGEMIPGDGLFQQQWWLKNTGQWLGAPGMDSRATFAWERTTGGADPETIVVIDSGCNRLHPDLIGRAHHGPVFSQELNPTPEDLVNHGTAVCGIAAAQGNGGGMVAGIDWTARILSLKVGYSNGSIPSSDIYAALDWARNEGYRFVNISAGGLEQLAGQRVIVRNAYYCGMFIACAAGNNGSSLMDWPAAYTPYVTAVGSADNTGSRWRDGVTIRWERFGITDPACNTPVAGSNYGQGLTLLAPGGRFVQTTAAAGDYWTIDPFAHQGEWNCAPLGRLGFGGTSASAPVVAGAATLVASYAGGHLSGEDLRELMSRTATDVLPSGWDSETGWGRLNIEDALFAVRPGIAIVRGTAGQVAEVSRQDGFTARIRDWPGIPYGDYSAQRRVYRARIEHPTAFAGTYHCWPRQVDSWGTGTLPARIYFQAWNVTDPQWDPKVWIVESDANGVLLETHLYLLTDAAGQTYWWPANPTGLRMAYTAIGVPVTALDVDPISKVPLLDLWCPSIVAEPRTVVRFTTPGKGHVRLALYDVAGRKLDELIDEDTVGGEHRLTWNRNSATGAAGVLFLRLDWEDRHRTTRLVVLR